MFCSQCGSEIYADANFCQKCSCPLSATTSSTVKSSSEQYDQLEKGATEIPKASEHIPLEDYYKILGVTPDVSQVELKKRYRHLAMKYHPDRAASNRTKNAEETFNRIREAYDVLSNSNEGLERTSTEETQSSNSKPESPKKPRKEEDSFTWVIAVMVVLALFNPTESDHRKAILKELKTRVAEAPFGGLTNALGITSIAAENAKIKYNNYYAFSTTTNPDGKCITFGILNYIQTTF